MAATARTRNFDEGPAQNQTHFVYTNASGVDSDVYYNYDGAYTNNVCDDYVVDGYHSRIAAGEVINNPCEMTFSSMEESVSDMKYTAYYPGYPPEKTTFIPEDGGNLSAQYRESYLPQWAHGNQADAMSTQLEADAKQICLAKVDKTPYEFLEDLGEIGETIRFLKNPIKGIADLADVYRRKVKRIKRQQLKDEAKALANLWNQYRFAFLPLVRSLVDAIAVAEGWNDITRAPRRSAHARTSDQSSDQSSPLLQTGGRYYFQWSKEDIREEQVHASILYEVTNPVADWRFKLGLRSKDIPRVAWELIPLSFMVDRLYDVRSMIAGALNLADPTVAILAGAVTTREYSEQKISLIARWDIYSAFTWDISDSDHFLYKDFSYKRDSWTPEISDTLPIIDRRQLVQDFESILDLIAISISRLL